jgi:hypothetical protein
MERIDRAGGHSYMSPDEIEKWYKVLEEEHATYLAKYGVSFPARDTVKALWLVFLRKYKGKLVHKDTISSFVNTVNPNAGKDQQVRHLAADGWFILNKGDRIPDGDGTVPSGYHVLVTTESPKPTFIFKSLKRAGRLAAKNFGELKAVYDFRCATCGSQEGHPNFLEPDKRTELQQGHMNPSKPLTMENSIPQCQVCNQVYRDDFVFDAKGRVVAVASANPVLRATEEVREAIKELLG